MCNLDCFVVGTLLCMNSPIDPALLQLVQKEVKFLQDNVNNLSAIILEEMKQMVERLKTFQGNLTNQQQKQFYSLYTRVR